MLRRLAKAAAASFVLAGNGRIVRENDPDGSEGPRLFMAGCPERNLVLVRQDVSDEIAQAIARTVEDERPWFDAETLPGCMDTLVEVLAREAPAASVSASLIFALPYDRPAARASIVRSGTADGDRLLARLRGDGMPSHLVEAGFASVADFWAPWCVVLEADEIAAIAFAARLGDAAAEIGVYTFPAHRGRGLAAAATAAWSSLPELRDRELFYSTLSTNTSSRRVAARLGLEHIGMGLRIT
jgi:hypothetical protein